MSTAATARSSSISPPPQPQLQDGHVVDGELVALDETGRVLAQEALGPLSKLDATFSNALGQGNYIKTAYDDGLLSLLRDA